jgi:hypothetical protein
VRKIFLFVLMLLAVVTVACVVHSCADSPTRSSDSLSKSAVMSLTPPEAVPGTGNDQVYGIRIDGSMSFSLRADTTVYNAFMAEWNSMVFGGVSTMEGAPAFRPVPATVDEFTALDGVVWQNCDFPYVTIQTDSCPLNENSEGTVFVVVRVKGVRAVLPGVTTSVEIRRTLDGHFCPVQ